MLMGEFGIVGNALPDQVVYPVGPARGDLVDAAAGVEAILRELVVGHGDVASLGVSQLRHLVPGEEFAHVV